MVSQSKDTGWGGVRERQTEHKNKKKGRVHFLLTTAKQACDKAALGRRVYLDSWSQIPQPVIPGFADSGPIVRQSIMTNTRIVWKWSTGKRV